METSSMLKNSVTGQQFVFCWELWLVPAHSSNHGQFSLKILCAKGMQCEEIVTTVLLCVTLESSCLLEYNASALISFRMCPTNLDRQIPGIASTGITGCPDFNAIFDSFTLY